MNTILKSITFPSGQRLEISQGDITRDAVEAIVNAANSQLLHGGGVAGVISRRGGPRIQQESNDWVRENGAINFRTPAYTSAGDLPYRYILHAVGPVWGEGDEERKLDTTIRSTLELAERLRIGSIAFPAISSGIFGFPKSQAIEVILKAIVAYFHSQPTTNITTVRLTLYDQEMADLALAASASLD